MRVVAGEAGGRQLVAPEGTNTRPTSDRVREAIFNMLFSLDAIDDARVCDLYAGSGALGIEALSRGAASCVFVERDRAAIEAIHENLETLGFEDRATVVQADVLAWIDRAAGDSAEFDLVLADPPYAEEDWDTLLDRIDSAIFVAESSTPIAANPRWDALREKKYGTTLVSVFTRNRSDS